MLAKKTLSINLNKVNQIDVNLIGMKAMNLGILIKNDFHVPEGYVISTYAYESFLQHNNLEEVIENTLSETNYDDFDSINSTSNRIKNLFLESEVPNHIISEVESIYNSLDGVSLAIRSSASAEDLPRASFAGQYDTYLNINGVEDILHHIKLCFSSLWNKRAISYRNKNKISHIKLGIAVIIQKMISAKSAGVIFTNNPVSLDKSQLIIESNYGLGESIVSGEITPDQFIIQKMGKMKPAFKIIDKRIGNKKISFHSKSLKDGSGIEQFNLPDHLNEKPSLSDKHIYELSKIGIAIEKLFRKKPQDIEWAIDKNNKIHILQSRPITSKTPFELEKTTLYSRGYSDDY